MACFYFSIFYGNDAAKIMMVDRVPFETVILSTSMFRSFTKSYSQKIIILIYVRINEMLISVDTRDPISVKSIKCEYS